MGSMDFLGRVSARVSGLGMFAALCSASASVAAAAARSSQEGRQYMPVCCPSPSPPRRHHTGATA